MSRQPMIAFTLLIIAHGCYSMDSKHKKSKIDQTTNVVDILDLYLPSVLRNVVCVYIPYFTEQYSYNDYLDCEASIAFVRLSPDESMIASAGQQENDSESSIWFHDSKSGKRATTSPPMSVPIYDGAWSADSRYFSTSMAPGKFSVITLYPDRPTSALVQTPTAFVDNKDYWSGVLFKDPFISSSKVIKKADYLDKAEYCSALITYANREGNADYPFSIVPGVVILKHKRGESMIVDNFRSTCVPEPVLPEKICFLNEGKHLGAFLPTVRIFTVFDPHALGEPAKFTIDNISAVDLTGSAPVLGLSDGRISIQNQAGDQSIKVLKAFRGSAVNLVSASSATIAASSGKRIEILSRTHDEQRASLLHPGYHPISQLSLNYPGTILAYASDATVTLVDTESGLITQKIAFLHAINSLLWSKKEELFVATRKQIKKLSAAFSGKEDAISIQGKADAGSGNE